MLRRAHRTSETLNAPNQARAILHVAQSFADELAIANPRFDRLRFIKTSRRIRHDHAIEIHTHLLELQAERVLASIEGLAVDSVYMADLDGEIEATARAYVGVAVTEIATLRAELSGPQVG